MLKKKIFAIGGAVVVTAALIAGATYAWFSDYETDTTKASLAAGYLDIELTPDYDGANGMIPGETEMKYVFPKEDGDQVIKYTIANKSTAGKTVFVEFNPGNLGLDVYKIPYEDEDYLTEEIPVNGKLIKFIQDAKRTDLLNGQGSIITSLKADDDMTILPEPFKKYNYDDLSYRITDASGNETDVFPIEFEVTKNYFGQFFASSLGTPVKAQVIGGKYYFELATGEAVTCSLKMVFTEYARNDMQYSVASYGGATALATQDQEAAVRDLFGGTVADAFYPTAP